MRKSETTRIVLWGGAYLGLIVGLVWSRVVGLDLSFWNDEVVTVTRYAGAGPQAIFFADYIPNNHVLFEILAWITTRVLGESEVTYRLWGLLPAIGATAWLTWWASRRFGHLVAVAVALLMLVSPLLLEISRDARGYGLAMVAMVGLITQADSALRKPEGAGVWRFAGFGLIGVLTLPVFVLPFLFAALPLVLDSRLRTRLVLAVAASGVVALAWFSPMLLEILEQSSQEIGRPVPWYGFVTLSMKHLLFPVSRLLLPGESNILEVNPHDPLYATLVWHAISWTLLGIGGFLLWRRKDRLLLASWALPIIGTYLTLAAAGLWLVDRFGSYLSLPIFVLVALGVRGLVDLVPDRRRRMAHFALAGLAVWLLLSFLPVADRVTSVPHEAFKEAATLANQSEADLVMTNSARPIGLQYYLDVSPQIMSAVDLQNLFCGEQTAYIFIEHDFRAETVDTSCLEAAGAARTRIEQRGRGNHIDVWFVGLPKVEPGI